MASSLLSPAAVNLHYHHHNSSMLAATNPQLLLIHFFSSGSCSRSRLMFSGCSSLLPSVNSNIWSGRCGAASPHPPSPPESGPPSGEEEDPDSGSVASLSRFQESVQIFFAVLFWMSLFFWSSVWNGRKNGRSDKGPRFWK